MSSETKQKKKFYPEINSECCKGCVRCVKACPVSVLIMDTELNAMGYPSVKYAGEGCIGCGACFYNCPEPDAIIVIEETED